MPLKPVASTILLPLETERDVEALVQALVQVKADPSASRKEDLKRDLGDHFSYLAGVNPALFLPVRDRLLLLPDTDLRNLAIGDCDMAVLFAGASEEATEHIVGLARAQPDDWHWHSFLAGLGNEHALAAAAQLGREHGQTEHFRSLGVWIPPSGPAQRRYSVERRAIFLRPLGNGQLQDCLHPVGLPLDHVVQQRGGMVTWHYASFSLEHLPGLPVWPADKLHLVGPRLDTLYTLFSTLQPDGRYAPLDVVGHENGNESVLPLLRCMNWLRFMPKSAAGIWLALRYGADEGMLEDHAALRDLEQRAPDQAQLELRPFDADLVYCNGHIQSTEGVVGVAGGAPIPLGPPPDCPRCQRLMFHVLNVEHHVRTYGDGFRMLFVCETCQVTACQATGWN